jgi:transposase InsO family protein
VWAGAGPAGSHCFKGRATTTERTGRTTGPSGHGWASSRRCCSAGASKGFACCCGARGGRRTRRGRTGLHCEEGLSLRTKVRKRRGSHLRVVAAALDALATERGYPKIITVDNGGEFYSKEMDAWAYRRGGRLDFIRSSKPVENGFIERLTGRLRGEVLNAELFLDISHARMKLEAWRRDYSGNRLHSAFRHDTYGVRRTNGPK